MVASNYLHILRAVLSTLLGIYKGFIWINSQLPYNVFISNLH